MNVSLFSTRRKPAPRPDPRRVFRRFLRLLEKKLAPPARFSTPITREKA